MSKPVFYLFNGKVGRFGSGVLGFTPPPPDPMGPVQIGTQIWSSKNLAIDDGGEGIYTKTFNYGQGDVVQHYYTWAAAVRVAASISGWHLPSKDEFDALISYIGQSDGNKLKSTYGWDITGTDDYGFAAFPAGRYSSSTSDFTETNQAEFWSSTVYRSNANYFLLEAGGSIKDRYLIPQTDGCSVRLIKDS